MSVSRREVVHREPIDNECLIRLVRQRPCLYDKDDPTYRDQIKKDNVWLEICRGSFEDWDIMTNSQYSEKLTAIQVRWKGLRDCYKRYLRKLLEARSGSGSKRVVPYVHAEELEFLRPSMELRETQSSWQVAQEGQESPPEPQGLQEHRSVDETITQEMNPEILDTQETAGPSQVQRPGPEPEPMQARSTRTARPCGSRVDNMQRFADLMDRLNQKLDDLDSEEHAFGLMVAGMLKKLPEDRRHNAKKAVMDKLNEQSIGSSPNFGPPPPSGAYHYSNPPPPRSQRYYPSRFRPYSDEYGTMQNFSRPPIPYPSPSPIPSTFGAPSQSPSTSSVTSYSEYVPSYQQL